MDDYSDGHSMEIMPNTTDPLIDEELDPHYIYHDQNLPQRNILWLHLSGAGVSPMAYTEFVSAVGRQGYHSIGLSWPNQFSLNLNCFNYDDPGCFDSIRLEAFDGVNRTHLVWIDENPANSLLNRLVKLLNYLTEMNASSGWGQYLDDSRKIPQWHKIAVSGHSLGAGQAGLMAQQFSLARAVFFAGPHDWNAYYDWNFARWVVSSFATALDRMYGFIHTQDNFYTISNKTPRNWGQIGLLGEEILVENSLPPFNLSHRLVTNLADVSPHLGVVTDGFLPSNETDYAVLMDVWNYLVTNVTTALPGSYYSSVPSIPDTTSSHISSTSPIPVDEDLSSSEVTLAPLPIFSSLVFICYRRLTRR